uniref:Uncharacterized protein n=1 Tax=Magallana gigas TaxID=29159 RepID=K1R2X4_MAGGI
MINTSIVCGSIDNFGGSKDRVVKIKGDINPSELPGGTRTAQINNNPIGLPQCPVICLMYTIKKKEITAHHSPKYQCEELKKKEEDKVLVS